MHKNKDLVIEIFATQGWDVTKSKLKSWDTKTGKPSPNYREMPREALDDFIDGLYKRKLACKKQMKMGQTKSVEVLEGEFLARYNVLDNFSNVTELAGRLSGSPPSEANSSVFKKLSAKKEHPK